MKITQKCVALAVVFSSLLVAPKMPAQQAVGDRQTAQQQSPPPSNQGAGVSAAPKTFTGVIAKSGDRLVLTDPLTQTSYQLDDQRKAQEMVNKNVRVIGVLDPSTGTIRVSAIEPQ